MPIRLLVCVVGDDHPKACTGRRLLHLGRAVPVGRIDGLSPPPLVLDPYAPNPLSRADEPAARTAGVVALDCSWNRLSERGRLHDDEGRRRSIRHRRLPLLLAGNPQHFGRLGELNTAEALAAAISILGREAEAHALLTGFTGSDGFWSLNAERLRAYREAAGPEEIIAAERRLFGGAGTSPTKPERPARSSRSRAGDRA